MMEFGIGIAVGAVLCYLFTRGGRRNEAKPSIPESEPPLNNNKDKVVVKPARGQYKMVLVVRTDLKMGTGKVAAQCGHATLGAYKRALKRDPSVVKGWSQGGQMKIALRGQGGEAELHTLEEQAKALGIATYLVMDAGHTQVDPGTETVLAIGPAKVEDINKLTGHMKLL